MHPGAWLAWTFFGGIAVMTTTNPFYLLPALGACYLVHTVHGQEGPHARSFRFFLFFGALTMTTRTLLALFSPGGAGAESFAFAALEGLRLAVLLVLFGTFNSVSDPFRVLRLSPRRFHEPALAAALALSIAPRTIDAAVRVREAQRLRGLDISRWRSWPALAVPVLETGMEEAMTLAESMDARGHGRGSRSRYRPDPWTLRSSLVTLGAPAVAAVVVFAVVEVVGDVTVSTFPLRWPEAHPVLVVAALGLAMPAAFGVER
ncbi:MAG: energy-coupling factor transporter transmembrane component T family protein [Actinomycetota bacterium]